MRQIKLRHPRLWQRVSSVMWARRALWLLAPLAVYMMVRQRVAVPGIFATIFAATILGKALAAWEQSLRRQFVRDAALPGFLIDKVQAAHPGLTQRDGELVLRGLRQFFMAHLRSKRQFVGMPSKVVDTAWHEFILHTRAYELWCDSAFGKLLHHTPAEVLSRNNAKRNDGLRRTWYWACKEESIDPRLPTRLPLLFALDKKFGIEGGFVYEANCKSIENASRSDTHCGSDFGGGSSGDGDSAGFGGSESSGGGEGGASGDGCGGGCGGGD